jgi:hypothetical protein
MYWYLFVSASYSILVPRGAFDNPGSCRFFCTGPRKNPHFMQAHYMPHCDTPGYCPAYTIPPPSPGFLLFSFTGLIFSEFLGILEFNHPSNQVRVVLVSPLFRASPVV